MQSDTSIESCANCCGRDVIFSGVVCGSLVNFCDRFPAITRLKAILATGLIGLPAADATKVTFAPFGLLLGWGLNDPWV